MRGLFAITRTERTLLLVFVVFSMIDMFLTIQLVQNGYLVMELMPWMKKFFMMSTPSDGYSYWIFVVAKTALTLIGAFLILRLAQVRPSTRRVAFVLPACMLIIVCLANGLVGIAT